LWLNNLVLSIEKKGAEDLISLLSGNQRTEDLFSVLSGGEDKVLRSLFTGDQKDEEIKTLSPFLTGSKGLLSRTCLLHVSKGGTRDHQIVNLKV
jgi:hypothetical protein